MKLLRIVLFILFALVSQAQAQSFVLPGGIAVDPSPPLDVTYQIVPSYDPDEKVLAGWEGDKLLYFVTVEKLPAGWLNPDKYFQGLVNDLRAAGRIVETAKSGKYKSTSTLSGQSLILRHRTASQAKGGSQAVHFLTDGKVAYIAFATLMDQSAEDRMLDETTLIFQSAVLASGLPAEAAKKTSESPYVGAWHWSGTAPNGNPAKAAMILKEDLSFSTEIKSQGALVFDAAGVWSVSGGRLFLTYMRSRPPLPADKKEDEDEIISLDGDRLVLRSKLSGKEREFLRQK
jgi:hypothetical protein